MDDTSRGPAGAPPAPDPAPGPGPPSGAAARRSGLLRRSGRLAVLLVAVALLFELAVRLISPLPAVAAYLRHPRVPVDYDDARNLEELLDMSILGFRPRTKLADFVLNSRSLKTVEYATEKPAGTLRVLALGDSFTFSCGGLPHDTLWHHHLAEALRPLTDLDVEVLNLGVPATDAGFARRMWELEGSRLDADLVVFGFPVASNFGAAISAGSSPSFFERCLQWSLGCRLLDNLLRLWSNHEQVARRIAQSQRTHTPQAVGGVPAREVLPGFSFPHDDDEPELSESRYMDLQRSYYKTCSGIDVEAALPAIEEDLTRLSSGVEAAGATFVLMVIPAELQLSPALRRRVADRLAAEAGIELSENESIVPQQLLAELGRREGISVLDLLPLFRDAPPGERLYRPLGTHWSPAGNALAAQLLTAYLTTPGRGGSPSLWEQLHP